MKKTGSRLTLRWAGWAALLSLALTLAALGAMNAVSEPRTVAVIEGKTEFLRYRSFNPQLSSFAVSGFRVAYADEPALEDTCPVGTLVPAVDSLIEYTKREGQPLGLGITGAGGEFRRGSDIRTFAGSMGLFEDPSCGGVEVRKLPVWGPGQIGNTFTVRTDGIGPILISGTLSVFGKTLDLGWFGRGGTLYAATARPIALPPGGWVWTDGTLEGSDAFLSPEDSALFGFVQLQDDAFEFNLTTETPLLQLVTPGGRLEPGRVEIGMFAQILNDPNVLRLQLLVLIFFFLLPVITDLIGLSLQHPARKNEDA